MTIIEEIESLNEILSIINQSWFVENPALDLSAYAIIKALLETRQEDPDPLAITSILLRALKIFVNNGTKAMNGEKL